MIEALFVGGEMNGRLEALSRPFPTHSFRMYRPNAKKDMARFWLADNPAVTVVDNHCIDLVYVLDTKNFEPYVYVLKGMDARSRDRAHAEAIRMITQPAEERRRLAFDSIGLLRDRPLSKIPLSRD